MTIGTLSKWLLADKRTRGTLECALPSEFSRDLSDAKFVMYYYDIQYRDKDKGTTIYCQWPFRWEFNGERVSCDEYAKLDIDVSVYQATRHWCCSHSPRAVSIDLDKDFKGE